MSIVLNRQPIEAVLSRAEVHRPNTSDAVPREFATNVVRELGGSAGLTAAVAGGSADPMLKLARLSGTPISSLEGLSQTDVDYLRNACSKLLAASTYQPPPMVTLRYSVLSNNEGQSKLCSALNSLKGAEDSRIGYSWQWTEARFRRIGTDGWGKTLHGAWATVSLTVPSDRVGWAKNALETVTFRRSPL